MLILLSHINQPSENAYEFTVASEQGTSELLLHRYHQYTQDIVKLIILCCIARMFVRMKFSIMKMKIWQILYLANG